LANHREKTRQSRRLQSPRAKSIGDSDIAGTRSTEKSGHPERRVGTQDGWITVFIVEAAEQHVHSFQTFERF